MRYVYDFDEPSDGGRALLGGKGIGLAEMTQLGLPVPAGFTITTEACRDAMARGGGFPDGLEDEVIEHVERLEQRTGKRFGDPHDPLLVSVRSGAAVSMPGMMDTILNVGLSDVAVRGLAETTGNPRFAYDSYRRLIQMYGDTVDGVDPHRFESNLQKLKDERGVAQDVDLSADDLAGLVETFKAIYEHDVGRAVCAGRARAAAPRGRGRVRLLEHAARPGLPAGARDPRRSRHRRQRRADGVRQQGRALRDRRRVHP